MKRLLPFCVLLLLLAAGMMSSCGGDDGGDAVVTNDYIRIDNNVNSITLGANEKQKMFSVYSNCSWSITVSATNWSTLSLDRSEGSGNVDIWIATDENATTASRTATLTFRSPDITKSVTITQNAGDLSLTVSPGSYEFAADGGEYSFTVRGNSDWRVTAKPDWCDITSGMEGKSGESLLTVKVGENPNTTPQNGQIVITGEKTVTIEVSQKAKSYSLTVNPGALSFDASGDQSLTFHLTSNGSWTVSVNEFWCRVSKAAGSSNFPAGEDITVSCQPNTSETSRPAVITIVAGANAAVQTISVTQTQATRPVVGIVENISQTDTKVTLRSSFQSMFDVTEYGFCYYDETAGAAQEQTVRMGTNGGKNGTIQGDLTLAGGKKYQVRAYAVSVVGIAYGSYIPIEMAGRRPGNGDNDSPNL